MDKMFWVIGLVAVYLAVTLFIDMYDEERARGEKDHMHTSYDAYLHKEIAEPRNEVVSDDAPSVSQGVHLRGNASSSTGSTATNNELVNDSGGGSTNVEGTTGWYFPLDATVMITDGYGTRSDFHSGIDLDWNVTPPNENVYAVNSGTVEKVIYHNSWGYYAEIKHQVDNQEFYSLYAHLKSLPTIARGSTINAGDVVGQMGSTGNSSGQHLHLEIGVKDDANRTKFRNIETPQLVTLAEQRSWWYNNSVSWSRLDPRRFFTELDGKPIGAVMQRAGNTNTAEGP